MSDIAERTTESEHAPTTTETFAKGPMEVEVTAGRVYWWCACGKSRQQPFCDGSHKGTEFTPARYEASETGAKRFCACKRTQTPPFCDGSHTACNNE